MATAPTEVRSSNGSLTAPGSTHDDTQPQYDPSGRYQKSPTRIEQSRGIRHVYKAFDTETAVEVAWQEYWGISATTMNAIEKSIDVLKSLEHEHIIKYHEGWVDRKQKKVIFITEAMPTGRGAISNVRRFLSRNVKMKSSVLQNWLGQVLKGLQFLHTHDPPWFHRDLRCENIYIRGNVGLLKIGGLELGIFIQNSHPAEFDGTPGYMPPELAEDKFDSRSDIYAFGMCALEMFTFKYPYGECSTSYQIFGKQLNNVPPEALGLIKDQSAVDIISKCLAPLEERPTSGELFAHSFLVGDDGSLESEDTDVEQQTMPTPLKIRERNLLDDQRRMSTNTPNEISMALSSPRHASQTLPNTANASYQQMLSTALEQTMRQTKQTMPIVGNPSIKCYSSDGRCIRLYYRDIFSIDVLRQLIVSDFEVKHDVQVILQYLDIDGDKILITKRTTIIELLEFAQSIQALMH